MQFALLPIPLHAVTRKDFSHSQCLESPFSKGLHLSIQCWQARTSQCCQERAEAVEAVGCKCWQARTASVGRLGQYASVGGWQYVSVGRLGHASVGRHGQASAVRHRRKQRKLWGVTGVPGKKISLADSWDRGCFKRFVSIHPEFGKYVAVFQCVTDK